MIMVIITVAKTITSTAITTMSEPALCLLRAKYKICYQVCPCQPAYYEQDEKIQTIPENTNNTNLRYVPASTQPIASQQMVHAPALPAGLESSAKNHVGRGGEMMMIVLVMMMMMMMMKMMMVLMTMIVVMMMMLVWTKIKMMLCFSGMGRIVGTSVAARTEPSVTQLQAR